MRNRAGKSKTFAIIMKLPISLILLSLTLGASGEDKPQYRDAATHEQIALKLRKAAETDVQTIQNVTTGEDPSKVNPPSDLLSSSDIICFNGLFSPPLQITRNALESNQVRASWVGKSFTRQIAPGSLLSKFHGAKQRATLRLPRRPANKSARAPISSWPPSGAAQFQLRPLKNPLQHPKPRPNHEIHIDPLFFLFRFGQ